MILYNSNIRNITLLQRIKLVDMPITIHLSFHFTGIYEPRISLKWTPKLPTPNCPEFRAKGLIYSAVEH